MTAQGQRETAPWGRVGAAQVAAADDQPSWHRLPPHPAHGATGRRAGPVGSGHAGNLGRQCPALAEEPGRRAVHHHPVEGAGPRAAQDAGGERRRPVVVAVRDAGWLNRSRRGRSGGCRRAARSWRCRRPASSSPARATRGRPAPAAAATGTRPGRPRCGRAAISRHCRRCIATTTSSAPCGVHVAQQPERRARARACRRRGRASRCRRSRRRARGARPRDPGTGRGAGDPAEGAQADEGQDRDRRDERQRVARRHVLLPRPGGTRDTARSLPASSTSARRSRRARTREAGGREPEHGHRDRQRPPRQHERLQQVHRQPPHGTRAREQHVDAFEVVAGLRRDRTPVGPGAAGRDDQRDRPQQHAGR